VGAACPFLRSGVGAVSTQSLSNRYLGPAVLEGLARGLPARLALDAALAGDEGRGLRQVHVVDAAGRVAAHTGANCVDWCGDLAGEAFSVAGNMLANGEVIAATAAVMRSHAALPLPERMMAALHAGQAAGGDRRGRQSAALKLMTTEDFCDIDLRVDDHAEPLVELSRLLALWRVQAEPSQHTRPSRANPAGLTDLDAIEANWRARGMDLRLRR
jgi:uncharacterized Ntn-hydrolase superfamily protein